MRTLLLAVMLLLISPAVIAGHMAIDIDISADGIVTEEVELHIEADYDYVTYTSIEKPLSVSYEGDYTVSETEDGFVLTFRKKPGDYLAFSLQYEDMIDRSGSERVFRTSITPENAEEAEISLTLPLQHTLSEREPSATPRPDSVSSDGRRITLGWTFENPETIDIAVFYEGPRGSGTLTAVFFGVLIVLTAVYYLFHKRTVSSQISETLSSEEQKIVELVKSGVVKQKDVARRLEFSKSKMSKVVRKLEEKGLLEKEPHFKTNILKIKKI